MHDAPRNICIFGGSFNPPHIGHVFAAVWALQTLPIDELWWTPVYKHAFGKELLGWEERLALLDAAIDPCRSAMKVCTIEFQLHQESRTIDTLRALRKQYPEDTFSLLVGTDIVHEIPRWKEAELLQQTVTIYAIGRGGYTQTDTTQLVLPDVSSTALRQAIQHGEHGFYAPRLPKKVRELIEDNQWYTL